MSRLSKEKEKLLAWLNNSKQGVAEAVKRLDREGKGWVRNSALSSAARKAGLFEGTVSKEAAEAGQGKEGARIALVLSEGRRDDGLAEEELCSIVQRWAAQTQTTNPQNSEGEGVAEVMKALRKFLSKNGYKEIRDLAKRSFNLDSDGNLDKNELTKMLRTAHPAIPSPDIEYIEKEIVVGKYKDKYSVALLDKLILGANEAARASELENKDTSILDRNHQAVKEILQDFLRYCKKNNLAFEHLFKAEDKNQEGYVTKQAFLKVCEDNGFGLIDEDYSLLKKKYLRDLTGQINYKNIEEDMLLIDPNYYQLKEEIAPHSTRTAESIVEAIFNTIMKKFKSTLHFCEVVDRRGKKTISREDLFSYFKLLDHTLTQDEFFGVYKIVIPTRNPSMQYFELIQEVRRQLKPICIIWMGEMLNSFDKSQIGLGKHLKGRMTDGKIERRTLTEAFNQLRRFEENELDMFFDLLEIHEDQQGKFLWRSISEALFTEMARAQLRSQVEIRSFLDTTGLADDNSSSSKTIHSLGIIRSKLKLIGLKHVRDSFDSFDQNKSGTISYLEFERMITTKFPHFDEITLREAFRFINNGGEGLSISREDFEDTFLTKVPLDNRDELLYEETKWGARIFTDIDSKLKQKRLSFESLFPGNVMEITKLSDRISTELGLWQRNDLLRLLSEFVVGIEERTISLEDFARVLKRYSNGSGTNEAVYTQEQIRHATSLIQTIKERMTNKKYSPMRLFSKINRDNQDGINFEEMFVFLQAFKKHISPKEAEIIFEMVDLNKDQVISLDEYNRFFGLVDLSKQQNEFEDAGRRLDSIKDIVTDINSRILKSGKSARYIFSYNKGSISKSVFLERLSRIEFMQRQYSKFDEFVELLSHDTKKGYIDLDKLQYFLDKYNTDSEVGLKMTLNNKGDNEILDAFILNLLDLFDGNILGIVNFYDMNSNGDISKGEFVVASSKIFNGIDKKKATQVFNQMDKKGLGRISVSELKKQLIRVMNKYDHNDNESELNETNIMDNLSIGGSNIDEDDYEIEYSANTPRQKAEKYQEMKEEQIYTRIRKALNYKRDRLENILQDIDRTGKGMVYRDYLFDALVEAGAGDFPEAERKLIEGSVEHVDQQIYYIDFLDRVFPMGTSATSNSISSIDDLSQAFKKEMKTRIISSMQLFFEIKTGREPRSSEKLVDGYFERQNLKQACLKRSIRVDQRVFRKIYMDLDSDKDGQISYSDFRNIIIGQLSDRETMINKVRLELKGCNISVAKLFELAEVKDDSKITLDRFLIALEKSGANLDIVDAEILFQVLDTDHSESLDKQELEIVFKESEVKHLSLNNLRKRIYKHTAKKGIDFKSFLEEVDYRRMGIINRRMFSDMLEMLGFDGFSDDEKDKLFTDLDQDGDYMINLKEFERSYDEASVHLLFTFILDFKSKCIKEMTKDNIPLSIFIRKYDRDCDGFLNKDEFDRLTDELKIEGLEEQADKDFLFTTINSSKTGNLTRGELSSFLHDETICDVVDIIERARSIIRQRRVNLTELFERVDTDKSDNINFAEFSNLLSRCGINLNIIELDEVFTYTKPSKTSPSFGFKTFLDLFSPQKSFHPLNHNPSYFEGLEAPALHYYESRYHYSKDKRSFDFYENFDEERDKLEEAKFKHLFRNQSQSSISRKITKRSEGFDSQREIREDIPRLEVGDRRRGRDFERARDLDNGRHLRKEPRNTRNMRDSGIRGNATDIEKRRRVWKSKEHTINLRDVRELADGIHKTTVKNGVTLDVYLEYFDHDGSSKIEIDEFEEFVKTSRFHRDRKTVSSIFDFIDVQNTASLSKDDIRDFVLTYSLDGGDGTMAVQTLLPHIEAALIDIIKSEDEVRDVQSLFLKVTKGKYEMEKFEFEELIEGLRLPNHPTKTTIAAVFEFIDRERLGYVRMDDFLDVFEDAIKQRLLTQTPRDINRERKPLRKLDLTKNQTSILLHVLSRLESLGFTTPEAIKHEMDSNNSGKISLEEFASFSYNQKLFNNKYEEAEIFSLYKMDTVFFNINRFTEDLFIIKDKEEAHQIAGKSSLAKSRLDSKAIETRSTLQGGMGLNFDLKSTLAIMKEEIDYLSRSKRISILDIFDEFDYERLGYWMKEDLISFVDTIRDLQLSAAEKLEIFDYLDSDEDEKISKSEFFKNLMSQEYTNALIDYNYDSKPLITTMANTLTLLQKKSLFEITRTRQTEISEREFDNLIGKLGGDLQDSSIKEFRVKYELKGARDKYSLNLLNDAIVSFQKHLNSTSSSLKSRFRDDSPEEEIGRVRRNKRTQFSDLRDIPEDTSEPENDRNRPKPKRTIHDLDDSRNRGQKRRERGNSRSKFRDLEKRERSARRKQFDEFGRQSLASNASNLDQGNLENNSIFKREVEAPTEGRFARPNTGKGREVNASSDLITENQTLRFESQKLADELARKERELHDKEKKLKQMEEALKREKMNSSKNLMLPKSSVIPRRPQRSPQDMDVIYKVLANFINFMERDNTNFTKIFKYYDKKNCDLISEDLFFKAVTEDLGINHHPAIDLTCAYYSNGEGEVDLSALRSDLRMLMRGKKDNKNYSIIKKNRPDDFSIFSREKLTAYKAPTVSEEERIRYEDTIDSIRVYFASNKKYFIE